MGKENKKLLNSDDSRRESILKAAIAEFCNGYEKGSTDAIVKSAGVSKGLLFHYFGSKKELFLFTFDYARRLVMAEFYSLINLEQRDILERWRQIALLKMDLMKKYPMIFQFIGQAASSGNEEIKKEIMEQQTRHAGEVYPKLFYDIDRTLFRDDIDVDTAIRVILYTMEGYAQAETDPSKSAEDYYNEYERYLEDLERFMQLFRKSFYKQEV